MAWSLMAKVHSCMVKLNGCQVRTHDVADVLEVSSKLARLKVRCQKKNPAGIGQVRVIPHINALGDHSPCNVLNLWLARRRELVQIHPISNKLFITLSGKNLGRGVSTDSFRKHVAAEFGLGTAAHSLRKGGAQFWARRGTHEDATRQQGGWKTSEVMKAIYTALSPSEVRDELVRSRGKQHECADRDWGEAAQPWHLEGASARA